MPIFKKNNTDRGKPKQINLKEKININCFSYNNLHDFNNINNYNQTNEFNTNNNNNIKKNNKSILFEGIEYMKNINKINYNYNLNNNKINNTKISLLNNSTVFSPIIKLKNKGNHKHYLSIGAYSTKYNISKWDMLSICQCK